MAAVLNSGSCVREVNIVGDCVWGAYNTPYKPAIKNVFAVACTADTLLKLLNHHYAKSGIESLEIGIGVDYGRTLMIKAGFSGSGATHLAHEAGRGCNKPIYVGSDIYVNLPVADASLLSLTWLASHGNVYVGDLVTKDMEAWVESLKCRDASGHAIAAIISPPAQTGEVRGSQLLPLLTHLLQSVSKQSGLSRILSRLLRLLAGGLAGEDGIAELDATLVAPH